MIVSRVHDSTGSHIEPPLDQGWDDYTKLQWHAAVVAHDTGLPVTVRDGARRDGQGRTVPGFYSINVGYSSTAALDFHGMWDFLVGVSVGAAQATRRAALDQSRADAAHDVDGGSHA